MKRGITLPKRSRTMKDLQNREYINAAVQAYLESGGTIEKLPDQIAYPLFDDDFEDILMD